MGLIYSNDEGNGDDLIADVDTNPAGDTEKEYSTTGVVACLAEAPVDAHFYGLPKRPTFS